MLFPQCQFLAPNAKIIANARLASDAGSLVETASALRLSFGTSIWQCLAMHMLATEIYVSMTVFQGLPLDNQMNFTQLAMTKDDSERLCRMAYALQQKAGFKKPRSEGLTTDGLDGGSSGSLLVRNVTE
jgi:hypothetical protein